MLILTRDIGKSLMIGYDIKIMILNRLRLRGYQVRIGLMRQEGQP